MTSDTLNQLAASGPAGVVAALAIYALIRVYFQNVTLQKDLRDEVEKRVTEAKAYGEALSEKDKQIQEEINRRIEDAQLYAKAHNEATREAYKFSTSFEHLNAMIVERVKASQQRERDEDERYRNALEQKVKAIKATVGHRSPSKPHIDPGDDDG